MKFWLILLASLLAATPGWARTSPPRIAIGTAADGIRIVYDLPAPVRTLAVRAATQSAPPPGTHIRAVEAGLTYRRGRIESETPFRRATLMITPDDGEVDSVYPLLTRIAGRGFVLFAPYVLPDTPFSARVATGGGTRLLSRAEAAGGYVLVGAAPASRGSFLSLASTGTAPALEARFQARAGALLDFYSRRLHRRLARAPILIISIVDEPADRQHHFFRGDVTPNGVVLLRFHGTADQIADPNSTRQFTSFLAHELVHLWNRRRGEHPMQEAWLHEGSAEYLGWLAVATLWPDDISLERNLQNALNSCMAFLGPRPLMATTGDRAGLRYPCGAIAQWIADAGARGASRGRRTAFDLWAGLLARGDYSLAGFRTAAAALAPGTASLLERFIDSGLGWDALASVLAAQGAGIAANPPSDHALRFAAARPLALALCTAFSGAGSAGNDVYFTGDCGPLGNQVFLTRVAGLDPATQPRAVYERVRDACAAGQELVLTLRANGALFDRTIRCGTAIEPAVPDLVLRRALPLSPPARSGP